MRPPPARARGAQPAFRPCAEIAERIRDGYRRVITAARQPARTCKSVIENLDCLITLLGQALFVIRKALEEVRDAL